MRFMSELKRAAKPITNKHHRYFFANQATALIKINAVASVLIPHKKGLLMTCVYQAHVHLSGRI